MSEASFVYVRSYYWIVKNERRDNFNTQEVDFCTYVANTAINLHLLPVMTRLCLFLSV
ncbi:MAG: hypothetical protein ACI9O6_002701 [Glaciecola sp.]|jgi:hypothetical protein